MWVSASDAADSRGHHDSFRGAYGYSPSPMNSSSPPSSETRIFSDSVTHLLGRAPTTAPRFAKIVAASVLPYCLASWRGVHPFQKNKVSWYLVNEHCIERRRDTLGVLASQVTVQNQSWELAIENTYRVRLAC